ncbi:desumoylating isopeptidase 1-like [Halichondria panicea]|uniref:desumoylating isopeptidase 1-like n=1 Tax=Halichondria panicea TaxID=6063 RepID=UPI00312B3991
MATNKVQVYIYDLSRGLAAQLSPLFLGKQINGIWHTGVVVYGMEYFYGGLGIEFCPPGGTIMGPPNKVEDLGETGIPQEIFMEYLFELQDQFQPEKYNLLEHNCNTFSNEIAQFLTGKTIPDYITNLPAEVMSTPFGAQLKPFLETMFSGPNGGQSVTELQGTQHNSS